MTRTKHLGFNEAAKSADIEFLREKKIQSCRQQTNKKTLLNIYHVSTGLNYILFSL